MTIHNNEQNRDNGVTNNYPKRGLSVASALRILLVLCFCLVVFKLSSQDEVSSADRMLVDAVDTGDLQSARFAIARGASVNRHDDIGSTPLHTAAWRGDLAMAKLLIEAGARIDVIDSRTGETPLHSAARGVEPAMMTFLLVTGADPNAQTYADSEQCNGTIYPAGATALDIARMNGLTQLVPILSDADQLVQ